MTARDHAPQFRQRHRRHAIALPPTTAGCRRTWIQRAVDVQRFVLAGYRRASDRLRPAFAALGAWLDGPEQMADDLGPIAPPTRFEANLDRYLEAAGRWTLIAGLSVALAIVARLLMQSAGMG